MEKLYECPNKLHIPLTAKVAMVQTLCLYKKNETQLVGMVQALIKDI